MNIKKPFQIYPNRTQKKWMKASAKRTGFSMNAIVLQLINEEMAEEARAKRKLKEQDQC